MYVMVNVAWHKCLRKPALKAANDRLLRNKRFRKFASRTSYDKDEQKRLCSFAMGPDPRALKQMDTWHAGGHWHEPAVYPSKPPSAFGNTGNTPQGPTELQR